MLHYTLLSVHGGQGQGASCGGVMDDGRFGSPISPPPPPPPLIVTPIDVIENARKAQSLPGYYCQRANASPQGFRQAFLYGNAPAPAAPSYGGGGGRSSDDYGFKERSTSEAAKNDPGGGKTLAHHQEDKKSRRFLGGLFRRRRKGSSSSSSSSESGSDEQPRRKFFSRKGKKKSNAAKEKANGEHVVERDTVNLSVSPHTYGHQTTYLIATDTGKVLKMSPTGSLGRDVSNYYNNLDGNQHLRMTKTSQSMNFGRPGVSASHDSLAESAYGSINSSMRSSALGRSSSTDTLTRKERKEALKVRVEKMRERNRGSSSDEELASASSSVFGSGSSLNKSDSLLRRSRSSRTERYIRRKSQELETLKVETEKDRKNREAVQARILEIQKTQKGRQQKRTCDGREQWELYEKPKWSSQLLYREHDAFDSLANRYSAENSRTSSTKPQPQYIVRNIIDAANYNASLAPAGRASGPPESQYSSKVNNASPFNVLQNRQRSVSYESNINKASSLPPQYSNKPSAQQPPNSGGLTPPAPPPRDRSSLLSPYEFHRPISYSFENLNQEMSGPCDANGSPYYRKAPAPSARVESSVSPLPPRVRENPHQLPPAAPCRRSFSERYLNQNDANQGYSSLPGRPALPKIYVPLEPPSSLQSNSVKFEQSIQRPPPPLSESTCGASCKKLVISSVPPSPSSDYSSYVSDNSVRTQQQQRMSPSLIPFERESKLLGLKIPSAGENSRSSSPRVDPLGGFKPQKREELSPRPPSMTAVKQAGSLTSLSSRSDVQSPPSLKRTGKQEDDGSDSGSQIPCVDPLKNMSNRPLSMVAEKVESSEKDSPPLAPIKKPEPPKRNSSSATTCSRELLKQQFEASISKEDTKKTQIEHKFREFFLRERERLEKSKSANFEEALQELEAIYKSLNLNSDDILEGAEKRDSCWMNSSEAGEEDETSRGRSRTPRPPKRPTTPDKTKDDLHYRRVQSNNRNQPDAKKVLQMSGSYLLVSPVHEPPPLDPVVLAIPQEPPSLKEPDVVTDDVTVRNVQRANSIKVIDPQPPFGIPLGPVSQGSRSDYLSTPNPPSPNACRETNSIDEPDIVTDDLAFRALRKEGLTSNGQSSQSTNLFKLKELQPESKRSPVSIPRSKSVPRSLSVDRLVPSHRKSEVKSPSKNLRGHHRTKRGGKLYDSFKEALTDSESGASPLFGWRQNQSWIERANLSETKAENFSTSTETLTEISSLKALSQPDIRQAVIKESRHPTGGPEDRMNADDEDADEEGLLDNPFRAMLSEPDLTLPKQLVRVPIISEVPVGRLSVAEKKPYRPLDAIFHPKPKPFYLKADDGEEPTTGGERSPVDIAKLDNLISSLSQMDSKSGKSVSNSSGLVNASTSFPAGTEHPKKPPYVREAKDKIQELIRRHEGNNNNNNNNNNNSKPDSGSKFCDDVTAPPTSSSSSSTSLYSIPSPLVLSRPTAVMSTSITSRHFPTASSPERVTIEDSATVPLAYEASKRTYKVATMVSSSHDLDERESAAITPARRAQSVPPPVSAAATASSTFSSSSSSAHPSNEQTQNESPPPSQTFESHSSHQTGGLPLDPSTSSGAVVPRGNFAVCELPQEDESRSSSSSSSSGEIISCVALAPYYPDPSSDPRHRGPCCDHPVVAFCYVLACLVHLAGIETLTAVALVMAVASLLIAFSS